MTEAFGRGRSSSKRSSFQRRGGSTSNNSINNKIRRSEPTSKKECCSSRSPNSKSSNSGRRRSRTSTVPLKAGRRKSQGPDSGSSKEPSPPLSPPSSASKPKPNSQFYPSTRPRRRRRRTSPKSSSFQLSATSLSPTSRPTATTPPAFLWWLIVRHKIHRGSRTSSPTTTSPKETQLLHFFFFNFGEQSIEYARSKMGDTHHHHHPQATTSSRLGIRPSSGLSADIVEVVRGSHIVRSTGRKDRHSKVCTAKGPRDRRVRLAAHTAIQFYDVQDRLGYDRPSKAVDWLIKKAKAAIDELDELPSWNPHSVSTTTASTAVTAMETQNPTTTGFHCFAAVDAIGSANRRATMVGSGVSEQIVQNQNPLTNSTLLPPSLDSDAIADTIKSFFPMGASAGAAEAPSSTIQFQNYPPDLLSRTSSQSQDLRLSLHSFQDPILLQHQQAQAQHHQAQTHQNEQTLFSGTQQQNPLGFDGWTEHHHQQQQAEMNRFQRMVAWNSAGGGDTGNGGGSSSSAGFAFNSLLPTQQSTSSLQPSLFGQGHYFTSQRGPLQSSNSPSVRAWMMDQQNQQSISHDHHHHHQISPTIHHHHQSSSSISNMGFASGGGFSGFHIPARIHGEEEHDGISDKPSSASSNSRH